MEVYTIYFLLKKNNKQPTYPPLDLLMMTHPPSLGHN